MMNGEHDAHWLAGKVGFWGRLILGIYILFLPIVIVQAVICLWTVAIGHDNVKVHLWWFWCGEITTAEQALMICVGLLGALGGAMHATGSFVGFVGNRKLLRSWVWWYLARAPVGAALAMAVYFVLKGGLVPTAQSGLGAASGGTGMNPYGLGAFAVLAGLSSEIATQKLREVFETLFRPREQKKDPLDSANVPEIHSIAPESVKGGASAADAAIIIHGENFAQGDKVLIDGAEVPTKFVSEHELQATVPKAKLGEAGTLRVAVSRSKPNEAKSAVKELKVVV